MLFSCRKTKAVAATSPVIVTNVQNEQPLSRAELLAKARALQTPSASLIQKKQQLERLENQVAAISAKHAAKRTDIVNEGLTNIANIKF